MSANPLNDISAVYLQEVLEPQLGKKTDAPSGAKKVEKGKPGEEASAKRVRQFVYDVRYLAKRLNIPIEKAYNQRISSTTMTGPEKEAARQKLGIGSVSEEIVNEDGEKRSLVRYRDKNTGAITRKYATPEQIAKYRKNPNIVGVEKTAYKGDIKSQPYLRGEIGKKYDKSKDQDGDGDNDFADVMSARMQASGVSKNAANKKVSNKPYNKKSSKVDEALIGNQSKIDANHNNKIDANDFKILRNKKKVAKESFSNWRSDLIEAGKIEDPNTSQYQPKIKEKAVDNYGGGKNAVVKINPDFKEAIENMGGELIEMVELGEDFILEYSDIAAEYFCEQGLNEDGLDILIEDMGIEKFVDFVFEIGQEYNLTEARTLVGKKKTPATGKQLGVSRKAAPGKTTKAAVEKHGTTKKIAASPSSTIKKKTVAVKKAVEKQPASKKPVRDAIARGIFSAVKAYKSGMERHRAATQTAGKALKVAGKAASEFGKGFASGVKETGTAAKKVKKAVVGEENELDEKVTKKTSKEKIISDFVHSKDPKFAGDSKKERIRRALGAWRGMHPGEKMEEAAPVPTQQTQPAQTQQKPDPAIAAKQKQAIALQKQIEMKKLQALSKGVPITQTEEVEEIDELNRYAKETGKSLRTGKPTSTGGKYSGSDVNSQAMRSVLKSMGAGRAGVAARGKKKVPGQKPAAAGQPGGPASPAQKVAKRRAAAQAAQDMMHSRFD